MGQGRPRSPCLYKYHPNAEEKGGEKEKNNRKKKGRPRERVRPFLRKKGETEREKHKGF
jgi:hypothetical protein